MPVVLLVSYSGLWGGAERILVDFATGLEADCCLACPPGTLADAARDAGLKVFPLRARRLQLRAGARDRVLSSARLASHALEVRALARALAPDLVVAWGMRSALACLLGPRPHPTVVFAHHDLLPGPLIGTLVRRAASRAARVIALSNAVAADLDPGRKLGDRLTVAWPGVDLERWPASSAPVDPPEVLVVGALVEWKRPDLALEACALARRSRPDLRLRLAGSPLVGGEPVMNRLRERASQPDLAGAVEFAGWLEDPRPALTRASCLLHCAPREPFGMAVLESLAAGRPAVVPASAGPAEIVDESCGVLYAPGEPRAAAAAVLEVLSDPPRAARMGEHGRIRVSEHFSREAARTRSREAVEDLLTRSSAPRSNDFALVTVTHNSANEVNALLRSAARQLPGVPVVVVDCASSDETVAVAGRWDGVRVIALDQNVGFARGCNRGLAEVDAPVTILVNPDVELLDDSLAALTGEAMRGDRLLAPAVLSPDGSRQDSVHPLPTSGAELLNALLPAALVPGRAGVRLAPWRARSPRQVGWAVGCALAARTETFRRLGPFDERIFLYGEDLDLALRAAAAGVQTWFWPAARVLHHRAHSTRVAFGGEAFELLARARHDVVAQRLGQRRAALDDASQALTFASRLVLKRGLGRSASRERQQLAAVLGLRAVRT